MRRATPYLHEAAREFSPANSIVACRGAADILHVYQESLELCVTLHVIGTFEQRALKDKKGNSGGKMY